MGLYALITAFISAQTRIQNAKSGTLLGMVCTEKHKGGLIRGGNHSTQYGLYAETMRVALKEGVFTQKSVHLPLSPAPGLGTVSVDGTSKEKVKQKVYIC